jgi:hypothetical protein
LVPSRTNSGTGNLQSLGLQEGIALGDLAWHCHVSIVWSWISMVPPHVPSQCLNYFQVGRQT